MLSRKKNSKKNYANYFDGLRLVLLTYFEELANAEYQMEVIRRKDLVGIDLNSIWRLITPSNADTLSLEELNVFLISIGLDWPEFPALLFFKLDP